MFLVVHISIFIQKMRSIDPPCLFKTGKIGRLDRFLTKSIGFWKLNFFVDIYKKRIFIWTRGVAQGNANHGEKGGTSIVDENHFNNLISSLLNKQEWLYKLFVNTYSLCRFLIITKTIAMSLKILSYTIKKSILLQDFEVIANTAARR